MFLQFHMIHTNTGGQLQGDLLGTASLLSIHLQVSLFNPIGIGDFVSYKTRDGVWGWGWGWGSYMAPPASLLSIHLQVLLLLNLFNVQHRYICNGRSSKYER